MTSPSEHHIHLEPEEISIERKTDRQWCSYASSQYAKKLGFHHRDAAVIAISVSELASNVLKYAGSGSMTIKTIRQPKPGIEITVEDTGPGIADIDSAIQDGFSEGRYVEGKGFTSERRGLGSGLGAVARFMDDLMIENRQQGGLRVVVKKYLP